MLKGGEKMKRLFTFISTIGVLLGIVFAAVGCDNRVNVAPTASSASADMLLTTQGAFNADSTSTGTVFSVDTMTGYFLEFTGLNGLRLSIPESSGYDAFHNDLQNTFNKKQSVVTLLITFVDIEYEGAPVFVSSRISIKTNKAINPVNRYVYLLEDLVDTDDADTGMALRIPASYYNYLVQEREAGKSLGRVQFIIAWGGNNAYGASGTHNVNARLFTKDIPADSDDPQSPSFKLDDWSGVMAKITSDTGCSSEEVTRVLYIAGGVLALALLLALIRFIFGK